MKQVEILSFNLRSSTTGNPGTSLLATFDAICAGIFLGGCAVLKTADGMSVVPPRAVGQGRGDTHGVRIRDQELYSEFRDAALATYRRAAGEIVAAGYAVTEHRPVR